MGPLPDFQFMSGVSPGVLGVGSHSAAAAGYEAPAPGVPSDALELAIYAAENAAKKARIMPILDPTNPKMTDKVRLNSLLMRICRRPLRKGETVYETKNTPGGFQSTVTLNCLPGEWSGACWAGEPTRQRHLADCKAASAALASIADIPALAHLATNDLYKKRDFGSKGKGKGLFK